MFNFLSEPILWKDFLIVCAGVFIMNNMVYPFLQGFVTEFWRGIRSRR